MTAGNDGAIGDARKRQLATDQDELEQLRRWKAEAMPVLAGLQELGRALDLAIGERITGPAAAQAAQRLRDDVEGLHVAVDQEARVRQAAECSLARLRADVEAVITDRGAGDFAPLLPKLRAALARLEQNR